MDICAICYENKNLIKTECNHAFCKPCLKRIIKFKDDDEYVPCPMCRCIIIKTNNKSVNRDLNNHNKIVELKQEYPGFEFYRTKVTIEYKCLPYKDYNYPAKKKFNKKK